MSTATLDRLIRSVTDATGDDALLDRFVTRRDTSAFEMLLNRHGPRVLAVCRRLLPPEDAEDAFQATFLCLLRQARSIRERRDLRGWLLTVAHRIAMAALRRSQVAEGLDLRPPRERHFMTRVIVPDQAGLGPTVADAALKRGIPFHGRVIDRTTGEAVAARVRYHAVFPNPQVRKLPGGDVLDGFDTLNVTAKPDGSFTVGVVP